MSFKSLRREIAELRDMVQKLDARLICESSERGVGVASTQAQAQASGLDVATITGLTSRRVLSPSKGDKYLS